MDTIGDLRSEILDLKAEVERLRAKKNEYKERAREANNFTLQVLREQNAQLTNAFTRLAGALANKSEKLD
jgi:hypothetical protein